MSKNWLELGNTKPGAGTEAREWEVQKQRKEIIWLATAESLVSYLWLLSLVFRFHDLEACTHLDLGLLT